MEMPKPTDEDKARFRSMVPDDPRVEVKPMFGNLGAFVNGNMFMGLFGADIGIKLDAQQQEKLRAAGGGPFGPVERPMGGYTTPPGSWSDTKIRPWVASALTSVGQLPPKKAKPKKP